MRISENKSRALLRLYPHAGDLVVEAVITGETTASPRLFWHFPETDVFPVRPLDVITEVCLVLILFQVY